MTDSSQRPKSKILQSGISKESSIQWITITFINYTLMQQVQVKLQLQNVEVSLLRSVRGYKQRFGDRNLLWPLIWAAVRVIVTIISVGKMEMGKTTHKHTQTYIDEHIKSMKW